MAAVIAQSCRIGARLSRGCDRPAEDRQKRWGQGLPCGIVAEKNNSSGPVQAMKAVGSLVLALAVAACATVGPERVETDAANYSAAISRSERTNVLANIVALRYGEAPEFLELTQVVTSYSLEVDGRIGVGGSVGSGGGFPETLDVGTGSSFENAPTITYRPITGRDYLGSILLPVDEARVLASVPAGWPPDLVVGLLVKSMNGVSNGQAVGTARRAATPEFAELNRLFTSLTTSGALEIEVDLSSGGPRTVLFAENPELFSANTAAEMRRFREILRLSPSVRQFTIRKGRLPRQASEIAIQTRSVAGALSSIAAEIEVPADHITRGLTFPTVQRVSDTLPTVAVRTGPRPPRDAFAAIKRGGTWYWVEDTDFASKRVLSFISIMLSLVSRGDDSADPVLTISTR